MSLCFTCREIGACPYTCLVFPCPCSNNCCGIGVPPCGYNLCPYLLRLPYYYDFLHRSNMRWISLCSSRERASSKCCTGCGVACIDSIPITEWRQPGAQITLIISHGNGQDLKYLTDDVVPRLQCLHTPVNIVCYEYPGYSLSPLPTSEALCKQAAISVYQYVHEHCGVQARRIVLYGISLGTGPAIYTAATCEVGGLILQSPYTSIGATKLGLNMAKTLSCIDLFQSYRLAPNIQAPVQIFHGSVDDVVPPQCSRDLAPMFASVHGGAPFFCNGAGHNDVIELLHARGQYLPMFDSFLRSLPGVFESDAPEQMLLGRERLVS
eukprot:TRINITY_DN47593_c0_g1_i1.p1 TRINITY_DN47593_c0_g1~~TRINITY_DN47593_c0_g1_i1.p1  ORF type:complete len:335 (-),score=-9.68 TRINITY_DN47593_c0_g1_i1:15-983(-)